MTLVFIVYFYVYLFTHLIIIFSLVSRVCVCVYKAINFVGRKQRIKARTSHTQKIILSLFSVLHMKKRRTHRAPLHDGELVSDVGKNSF